MPYYHEDPSGPFVPPSSIKSSVVPQSSVPGLSLLQARPQVRPQARAYSPPTPSPPSPLAAAWPPPLARHMGSPRSPLSAAWPPAAAPGGAWPPAAAPGGEPTEGGAAEQPALKPGQILNFWGEPYVPALPAPLSARREPSPRPVKETSLHLTFWGHPDSYTPEVSPRPAAPQSPGRARAAWWRPEEQQPNQEDLDPDEGLIEDSPHLMQERRVGSEPIRAATTAKPRALMVHSSRADRGWRQNRTEDAPPAELFVDEEEDDALGFMPTREPVSRHAPALQVPRLVMPGHAGLVPNVPLGRSCEAQIEQLVSARLQGALSPRRSPRKPGLRVYGKPAPPNPEEKTLQLFEELSSGLEALLGTVGAGLACSCEPEKGHDELMFPVSLLDNSEFVSVSGQGLYEAQQSQKDGFDDIISEPFSPRRQPWQGAWWLSDQPKDENMRLKRQTELWSARTSDSLRTQSARLLGGPEQSQSLHVRSGKPPAPFVHEVQPVDERPDEEERSADPDADSHEDEEGPDRHAAGPQPEASRPLPEALQPESRPAPLAAKAASEAQDGGFMLSVSSWFSSAFGASGAASPEQGASAQAGDEQSGAEVLTEALDEAGSETGSGAAQHVAEEEPAEEEPAVTPRGRRRGAGAQDGKSVLGPSSAMSSSTASLLMGVQAKKKTARGGAGEAKSVLGGSTAMTSGAAGALAGALAAPRARKGGANAAEAKSVLGGASGMSSSAAGALGALALGRRKKSPRPDADADEGDQEVAPAGEADSRTPTPARAKAGRKDDGKSVLAASTGGMRSAASALSSALGTKKGSASRGGSLSPRVEEEQEEEAATPAAPAPKKRAASRKRLDGKSVISGMNATSSSSAGALLGSLVQKGR